MLVIAGAGASASRLRAQDATTPQSAPQATAASASATPADPVGATATPAAAPEAGPRITPPLERYQTSLPKRDRSETSAAVASGSHTIVLSTLALVLIVVIIVLLAVN
jgi:hypothetical protein